MEVADEKFESVKNDAKIFYDSIDTIFCPYLKKKVRLKNVAKATFFEDICLRFGLTAGEPKLSQMPSVKLTHFIGVVNLCVDKDCN